MRIHALMAAGLLLAAARAAQAEPADYVSVPTVVAGEREIDFKSGTQTQAGQARASAAALGLGYGVNDWWATEVYAKVKSENAQGAKFDAVEWENKFQLTETGKYPVDVGFLLEIEHPQVRSEGWEVDWGPLFQTEFGRIQLNFNPLFQRNYRAVGAPGTQFKYQWQAKYRWRQEFEFGLQGFGETGNWNAWARRDEQTNRLGPAIFGRLPLGGRQAIVYNAAWLFGASQAAPGHTLRLQIEYEF